MKYNLNRGDFVQLTDGRKGKVMDIHAHDGGVLATVHLTDGSKIQTSPLNIALKLNRRPPHEPVIDLDAERSSFA